MYIFWPNITFVSHPAFSQAEQLLLTLQGKDTTIQEAEITIKSNVLIALLTSLILKLLIPILTYI